MPNICPVCGEPYDEILRGEKVTIPVGYDDCHRSVALSSGGTVGKWYLHDEVTDGELVTDGGEPGHGDALLGQLKQAKQDGDLPAELAEKYDLDEEGNDE